jgi:hypothetical protein
MTGFSGFNMTNPIEVPDIQEIEKMDQLRQQAIDSLEISEDDLFVKCQRCGVAVRMAPKGMGIGRSNGDRIILLERQLKRVEWIHSKSRFRMSDMEYNDTVKEIKEELATLLKAEDTKDKLRRLPLYSSRITGFRYLCSACYDVLYKRRNRKKL